MFNKLPEELIVYILAFEGNTVRWRNRKFINKYIGDVSQILKIQLMPKFYGIKNIYERTCINLNENYKICFEYKIHNKIKLKYVKFDSIEFVLIVISYDVIEVNNILMYKNEIKKIYNYNDFGAYAYTN